LTRIQPLILLFSRRVIFTKLERYKISGKISKQQWRNILGVIKIQGNSLDMNYMKEWAEKLNMIDLLNKAMSDAKIK